VAYDAEIRFGLSIHEGEFRNRHTSGPRNADFPPPLRNFAIPTRYVRYRTDSRRPMVMMDPWPHRFAASSQEASPW
jgi:hypothetical protein